MLHYLLDQYLCGVQVFILHLFHVYCLLLKIMDTCVDRMDKYVFGNKTYVYMLVILVTRMT